MGLFSELGEEYHRRKEREQWSIENNIAERGNKIASEGLKFSSVAFIISFFALLFSGFAAFENASQAQASWIADRAWVDITGDLSNASLTWNAQGSPTLSIKLTATDEGNSPALQLKMAPLLMFGPTGQSPVIRREVIKTCDQAFGDLAQGDGQTVFVKDPLNPPDPESSQTWPDFHSPLKPVAPFDVELCAAYYVVGGGPHNHHSIRFFHVLTKQGLTPIIGQNMQAGSLLLEPRFDLNYND